MLKIDQACSRSGLWSIRSSNSSYRRSTTTLFHCRPSPRIVDLHGDQRVGSHPFDLLAGHGERVEMVIRISIVDWYNIRLPTIRTSCSSVDTDQSECLPVAKSVASFHQIAIGKGIGRMNDDAEAWLQTCQNFGSILAHVTDLDFGLPDTATISHKDAPFAPGSE